MAGGEGLLVDDRSDFEAFSHADIVRVLDHGDCLSHTEAFGGQTGEDVRFGMVREGHKSLGLADAFFFEK